MIYLYGLSMYMQAVLWACRLVNRSGLRLSYWTDETGQDGDMGCAYALNAWEESPLLVDPVERTVIIPDTQQQVSTAWVSCVKIGQCQCLCVDCLSGSCC